MTRSGVNLKCAMIQIKRIHYIGKNTYKNVAQRNKSNKCLKDQYKGYINSICVKMLIVAITINIIL